MNGAEIPDRQADGNFDDRRYARHDRPGKQRAKFYRLAALDLDLAELSRSGTAAASEGSG